jgi:hypothetical protein
MQGTGLTGRRAATKACFQALSLSKGGLAKPMRPAKQSGSLAHKYTPIVHIGAGQQAHDNSPKNRVDRIYRLNRICRHLFILSIL